MKSTNLQAGIALAALLTNLLAVSVALPAPRYNACDRMKARGIFP